VYVKAKKHLGQHFLKDNNIAQKIVESIVLDPSMVLEVGPGMGILTKFLAQKYQNLAVVEIDPESVHYLSENQIISSEKIIQDDFLKLSLSEIFPNREGCIIGNFPYNISSQIFFKVLENRQYISLIIGMVQYEVAKRIVSPPNSKEYGILSVLLQTFYHIELLFKVNPNVFVPPPKVNSAVLRLIRNDIAELPCDEKIFFRIIKTAFNQRRKMLRNSLKSLYPEDVLANPIFEKRPENLSVDDYISLTVLFENNSNK
jgi:16S rRNA (adenine1518-N6/adenine1519-N6)-dimethyltransferase